MDDCNVEAGLKKHYSGIAITSLVFGILGLLSLGGLKMLAAIPAILALILGFVALREIKKDNSKKGRGLAIVGLVFGIFVCLGLLGIFMAAMDAANR